jgi:hypothetical protein
VENCQQANLNEQLVDYAATTGTGIGTIIGMPLFWR